MDMQFVHRPRGNINAAGNEDTQKKKFEAIVEMTKIPYAHPNREGIRYQLQIKTQKIRIFKRHGMDAVMFDKKLKELLFLGCTGIRAMGRAF